MSSFNKHAELKDAKKSDSDSEYITDRSQNLNLVFQLRIVTGTLRNAFIDCFIHNIFFIEEFN